MGRKGNWFKTVKKALGLSPISKRKKEQKNKLSEKQKHRSSGSTHSVSIANQITQLEKVKLTCVENEEHCHAHPFPISNSPSMASTAAAQFVQPINVTQSTRKSKEEMAATKIQSVVRGYLARLEMRTFRGLLRLKSLVESSVAERQAMNSVRCMQLFVRVHSQIRSRRLRKLEENQALQKYLLQKHANELDIFQVGKEWNDSTHSKEQVEAKLLSKHEAARRRERALAYAFSQQRMWRNSSRSINPLFTDPNNPTWGWSWMERWMAAQQWRDATCGIDCGEINKADARFEVSSEANSPTASRSESHRYTFPSLPTPSRTRSVAEAKQFKSSNTRKSSVPDDEYSKADARFELNSEANSSTASRSESHRYTFASLSTPSTRRSITGAAKSKLSSTRKCSVPDDDCKSQASVRSDRSLRHSNGGPGLSLRDDESQTSESTLPSYMTFTESARAKSRLQSPFETEKNGVRARATFSSAKKQQLYPPSPAVSRRHSVRLIAA